MISELGLKNLIKGEDMRKEEILAKFKDKRTKLNNTIKGNNRGN